MNKTTDISNPLKYSFGNVFEWEGIPVEYVGINGAGNHIIYLEFGSQTKTVKNKELNVLLGITPTNLAEMAREKGDCTQITSYIKNIVDILIWKQGDFSSNGKRLKKNKNESFEAFCLRVARNKQYI